MVGPKKIIYKVFSVPKILFGGHHSTICVSEGGFAPSRYLEGEVEGGWPCFLVQFHCLQMQMQRYIFFCFNSLFKDHGKD